MNAQFTYWSDVDKTTKESDDGYYKGDIDFFYGRKLVRNNADGATCQSRRWANAQREQHQEEQHREQLWHKQNVIKMKGYHTIGAYLQTLMRQMLPVGPRWI